MKYIRKIPLPALLRYNFGDQSEAVRQDVDPRFGCDVRYIRSTTAGVYAHPAKRETELSVSLFVSKTVSTRE